MSDSLKSSRAAPARSPAKSAAIRLNVDDVMDAARWLVGLPVPCSLMPDTLAHVIAEAVAPDEEQEKALWLAVASYLSEYVCITDDEQAEALKAEWTKTETVPWPLPKRLRDFRLPPPAPVMIDGRTDDDVPF